MIVPVLVGIVGWFWVGVIACVSCLAVWKQVIYFAADCFIAREDSFRAYNLLMAAKNKDKENLGVVDK